MTFKGGCSMLLMVGVTFSTGNTVVDVDDLSLFTSMAIFTAVLCFRRDREKSKNN
jgi:hypothetical protein